MDTLLRGVAIGFAIAAPIGPIGILCIRRTLASGVATGIASGLGAATADAIYAFIAGAALALATHVLARIGTPLHVIGGLALIALGVRTLRERDSEETRASTPHPRDLVLAWASTIGLTLVNPATILSFAGIVAGTLGGTNALAVPAVAAFALGVFVGSSAWWVVLCGAVGAVRHGLGSRTMQLLRVASGALLGGFGVAALLTVG
jgi:threonine/homoserine/homoserine lactone efflux protein